jgi:sugar lactone lactonase YvrE
MFLASVLFIHPASAAPSWRMGAGPGNPAALGFDPFGIDVDPAQDYFFIADTDNNAVKIFDLDGNVTGMVLVPSTGYFLDPLAVKFDGAGHVYVTDKYYLYRFDVLFSGGDYTFNNMVKWDGNSTAPQMGGLNYPQGIAVYGNDLYVTDTYNDRVLKFDASTFTSTSIPVVWSGDLDPDPAVDATLDSPQGIAADSSGVYIGSRANYKLIKVKTDGSVLVKTTVVHGLTLHSDGNLYVAGYRSNGSLVTRYDANLNENSVFFTGNSNAIAPTHIGFDRAGALYLASYAQAAGYDGVYDTVWKLSLESPDNRLSGLSASGITLSPSFSSDTQAYTASVASNVMSTTITPSVSDSTATVTVNGQSVVSGSASAPIALSKGDNAITVVVTAPNGAPRTYTILANRAPYTDAALGALAISPGTLNETFASGTLSYTADVAYSVTSIDVTPTVNNSLATVKVNNTPATSGSAFHIPSLAAGPNTITVLVTAEDGVTSASYSIIVTRESDQTGPDVQISANGNTQPAKTAAATVTVADTQSGVASRQYAWTQSTAVPSDGWAAFNSGDTLTLEHVTGTWYLHIRAADAAGNITETVSNVYELDNTAPSASVSSSAGGTVNTAFPVTVVFSEAVSGFASSGILVNNGIISDFAAVNATTYTAAVIPVASGLEVTVYVAADTAADMAGNGNTASNTVGFLYDITKPVVAFGGFTADQTFTVPPSAVSVTVSEAVYWITGGIELDSSNALPLVSMEKDGVIFSGYEPSYDPHTRTFTVSFNHLLEDGNYAVQVADSLVKNARHNTLDGASAGFAIDTTAPVISVTMTVPAGSYEEDRWTNSAVTVNASVYSADGISSNTVSLDGGGFGPYTSPIILQTEGTHTLIFKAADSAGNEATESRTVLIDMTAPVLTLTGPASISLPIGSSYTDQGAVATDNVGIDGAVITAGSVNPNVPGTYILRYNAFDLAGNAAVEVIRTVAIVVRESSPFYAAPPVIKPVIDKNGIALDPSQIDTTKPSFSIEIQPKDGAAYVRIPASILSGLEDSNSSFIIEIVTPYGSYRVPVNLASLIPGLEELLAKNNLNSGDISFKITLTDESGSKDIQAAFAGGLPDGTAIGAIVDFSIEIVNNKAGQTIGTADKFTEALARVIPMPQSMTAMPEQWGAFRYNEAADKFEFAAATKLQIGGIWYVSISSYTNSVYVVAANAVSFADVQNHWGQSYVGLAAAKGLVEGVGGGTYAPDNTVTRAEFAAMLVRAIGRGTSTGNADPYADVQSGAWYHSVTAIAKQLGLLNYVQGNRFSPDQPLTREEMASMLAAAITLEKLPVTMEFVSLNRYRDAEGISAAYLENVRLMVKLDIMTGISEDTFGPKETTTRAQAAVVLIRTLQTLRMIDSDM